MSTQLLLSGQGSRLKEAGGVGKYAYELYRRIQSPRLQQYLPGSQVTGWNVPSSEEQPASSAGLSGAFVRQKLKSFARNWAPAEILALARSAYPQNTDRPLPLNVRSDSSERIILHEVTNYSSCHEAARLVMLPSTRLCVTFIDLQDLFYPEYFCDEELSTRRCHYSFYKDVAHQFFAISEFTKTSMVEKLGIPAQRIKVTYLAGHGSNGAIDSNHDSFARAFGRYLIYPAKFWKHKNHEFLMRAFSIRREQFRQESIRLLFTGGFTKSDTEALREIAGRYGITDQIQVLGFQPTEVLRALLRRAHFLVFPSKFEGFGMPVLEAFESGCPVLCSRQGALPEIAGDAAIYFDPGDIDSLVSVFDQVITGSIKRQQLLEKGRAQCLKFSWDRTFEETAVQYMKLA